MSVSAIALLGPTASGKTALALRIAQRYPCEIISLDSALVYRDMNIGTAKPSLAERGDVPHHLIDIISPLQVYSAADFVVDCMRLMTEIRARDRIALIVGGTMMYYHALTQGLNDLPAADPNIRMQLQRDKQERGIGYLYQKLQQVDKITAQRLDCNDSQRIERALEIYYLTDKPLSQHFAEQQRGTTSLSLHTVALIPQERHRLHTHINQRFINMIEQGFLDEVRHLRQVYPDLNANMSSMRCVGYRQAWAYLNGEITYEDFVNQGQAATRQLAKRQLTWLRKLSVEQCIDPYSQTQPMALFEPILDTIL